MTESQLKAAAEAVLAQLGQTPAPTHSRPIPVECSARHVHLTPAAAQALFGQAQLERARDLSQPGEFLSAQRVMIAAAKGCLENVAVLGPARGAVQAELSYTDARALGLEAPLRLSGDLSGAADVTLVGPAGSFFARGSAIVAQNHIHMTPGDAAAFGTAQGEFLRVRIASARPVTFEQAPVRVSEHYALAMHIDFDEANACALQPGDCGMVLGRGAAAPAPPQCADAKLITEQLALRLAQAGPVRLRRGTIVTPAAKDVFARANIPVEFL